MVICFHHRCTGIPFHQSILSIEIYAMRKTSPLKSLQRIHTAMLSGMVLFCIVSAVVHLSGRLNANPNLNKILQVVVLAVSFVCIKTGLTVFNRKLQLIPAEMPLLDKISLYRTAALIKWALMEIPVLLSVACFMITRNYAFIVLAFVLMLLFAFQGPLRQKIMLELQINHAELSALETNSE